MSNRFRGLQALPVWARWALPAVVAVLLIAGLVVAEHKAGPAGATSEEQAEAETNRIADIAITEDEAPHTASLAPGSSAQAALERAISGDVHERIESGKLTGPLQSISCSPAPSGSAARTPYRCMIRSDGTAYSFLAIVQQGKGRLTWCKVDPPAVSGGPEILVSPRCRA